MAEHLDNKLPTNWNSMPNRQLIIWIFYRITKRLEALEASAGVTPPVINEKEPDMYKIKKP